MAIQIWWWSEHICCNIEIVANLIYTESDVNLLPVTLFSENPSLEGTSKLALFPSQKTCPASYSLTHFASSLA